MGNSHTLASCGQGRERTLRYATSCFILAGLVVAAQAQAAQPANAMGKASTGSPEKTAILPTLTVSGDRHSSAVQQTKLEEGSTLTLTSEQMANKLMFTTKDIFRYEPSVQTVNSGRYGMNSVNVRGLDENRVSIQVDGLEMPESYGPTNSYLKSSRMGFDIQSIRSLTVVKGQDVQKGPGFGVVEVRTHSPEDFLKSSGNDGYASIMSGYSSADKGLFESATLANRTGNWESMLIVTNRNAQNMRSYTGSGKGSHTTGASRRQPDPGNNNNYDILAKVQKMTDTGRIGVIAEKFRSTSHLNNYSNDTASNHDYHSDDYLNRYRLGVYQDIVVETPLFDHVHWQLDYQRTETENASSLQYGATTPYDRLVSRKFDQSTVQLKGDFSKDVDFILPQTIAYGVALKQDRYYSINRDYNLDADTVKKDRYSPTGKRNSLGLYAQDRISFANGRGSLTPALRYDYYNYNITNQGLTSSQKYDGAKSGHFTGQLGGTWNLTPETQLFGKAGWAFRSPSYQDLYYDYYEHVSGMNINILANPDLKNETSRFVEGGIRTEGRFGSAELTAFNNSYHNFIDDTQMIGSSMTPAGPALNFSAVNIPKATIRGVEVKGQLDLDQVVNVSDGMYLRGAAAYISGKDKSNHSRIQSIPPFKAVVGIGYEAPDHRWGSELTGTYVHSVRKGQIEAAGVTYSPGSYEIFDLTGHVSLAHHVNLRAGIFNITNQKYVIWNDMTSPGASTFSGAGVDRLTQPGRNYGVSAQYVF